MAHLASDHDARNPSSGCANCLNVKIGDLQAQLEEQR